MWMGESGEVNEKTRRKFFSRLNKVKGGFNLSKCEQLLRDIDRDIGKIERLTKGATRLEPLKKQKDQHRFQPLYWQNIRDQAQRLFESLSSRFFPCSCNHMHQVNLRLDFQRESRLEETTRFALLLTFERSPKPLPWDWKDVEIESSPVSVTKYVYNPRSVL
jgi:hypothetical protein